MQEMLQELYQFLQVNNLDNFLISIIISIVGIIFAVVRTGKSSIQKKLGYVNLNKFNITDYVILYDKKILSFCDVKIKKKTDLTKLDLTNYIDVGGVLNDAKKNE